MKSSGDWWWLDGCIVLWIRGDPAGLVWAPGPDPAPKFSAVCPRVRGSASLSSILSSVEVVAMNLGAGPLQPFLYTGCQAQSTRCILPISVTTGGRKCQQGTQGRVCVHHSHQDRCLTCAFRAKV
jgi:hypothetical protein